MNQQERASLIRQLDASYTAMPDWVKKATLHAMNVPARNPETNEVFSSFMEILEAASDESLETLRDDFDSNGDLLPATRIQ